MKALRKVLVVDDDPVVGKSFDRVLSGKGYAVITAASGAEALDKLAREDYDVVFTDIRMPGMDGLEMAERVKARQPWLPVVIVTGYGNEANEARAKDIGASGFLHKPLSPETIEASARAALAEPAVAPAIEAAPTAAVAPAPKRGTAWNAAKLIAAPFLGLAFVIVFPFVGLAMLAWMGARALLGRLPRIARFARNVGLFFAAPFIGLAYAIAFPFVGLGLLALHGFRALARKKEPK